MPFVAPKSTSSTSGSNSGPGGVGRTTFRPPWVKDDGGAVTPPKPTVKTSVPWAKKNAAEKENGEKTAPTTTTTTTQSALKKPSTAAKVSEPLAPPKKPTETKKVIEPTKKTVELPKKVVEPARKIVEPAKKVVEPTKKIVAPVKSPPEPIKKTIAPTSASAAKTTTNATARNAAIKKKEPTPSSSEEESEEEEETEEEETEEETEEESEEEEETEDEEEQPIVVKQVLRKPQPQPKKEEEESELKRRFSIEKPKLRPVVVKRDKSMKKVEDDDEAIEGETEEERERRLRFKLDKPKLRHVKREEKPLPNKSTDNVLKLRPALKKVPKIEELIKEPKEDPKPEFKTKTLRKAPSISKANVPAPPPLPSLAPKAPPPPPPPLGAPGEKRLSPTQKAVIEKLKTRPRRRPDWSEMMKEVESGKKLRHVQCNDRSQPILTCKSMTKVDDKFIYETEKHNSHNKLLKQIQFGIRLKPTQTNDRSKPILNGLRKFRRQMTIEEQLQKSQSKVNMLGEAPGNAKNGGGDDATDGRSRTNSIVAALSIDDPSGDELDDIDKIRDDLQSTKQMLALELRNREAQERENKKLLAKIATLEAELAREKSREKNLEYGSNVIVATMDATPVSEEAYINSLKQEADDARKTSKELEKKYHDTGELLDEAKIEIEEQKRQIQTLERKLAQALQGDMTSSVKKSQFSFCYSYEDQNHLDNNYHMDSDDDMSYCYKTNKKGGGALNGSRRLSDVNTGRDSSPEFDLPMSESDPDEPEEKKNERRERRLVKEVKVLKSKLTKLKVKQEAAKKEKDVLKQTMKKNHVLLKAENKKFKKLEKEVHKMAASMKEEEEDDEAEEGKEDENEEADDAVEEESEEETEESESEESEPETESESEAEDATNADKKKNLEPRVKKHESRLSAMKKCNVLLQANVDNLQDEITQIRTKAASLQAELDSVLQDLGF